MLGPAATLSTKSVKSRPRSGLREGAAQLNSINTKAFETSQSVRPCSRCARYTTIAKLGWRCYCSHMNTNIVTCASVAKSDDALCEVPCFNAKLVRKLKAKMPAEEPLDEARRLFAALSDRTRIKLLLALGSDRELCVCDLAHVAGTTFSTASHHLRKLRDLRLLTHRTDGRMSFYALRDPRLAQLVALALGHRKE